MSRLSRIQARPAIGLAVLAALSPGAVRGSAAAQTADTVLFNGKILTVDKDFSIRRRWRSRTARCWRQAHRPR